MPATDVVTYEIRTLMNGVIDRPHCSWTPNSPTRRQYADIIRTGAEALLFLVNDILAVMKQAVYRSPKSFDHSDARWGKPRTGSACRTPFARPCGQAFPIKRP